MATPKSLSKCHSGLSPIYLRANGGSASDALKGAAITFASGEAFQGWGAQGPAALTPEGFFINGMIGGTTAVLSGDNFGHGFMSASIGAAVGAKTANIDYDIARVAIIQSIEEQLDYLKLMEKPVILSMAIVSLIVLAVCLKHPGFKEEQEWRIIYLPQIYPNSKPWIKSSVESIAGVPQVVHKIPLENNEALDITGLDLSELIDKIIIGPTQYPIAIFDAFRRTLEAADIEKSHSRIRLSDIPLRT